MTVSYGDATTPEAVRGRTLMRNEKLLEGLAADVNDSLKLPRDVELAGEQCGQANATWNSVKNRIKICYELVVRRRALRGDVQAVGRQARHRRPN